MAKQNERFDWQASERKRNTHNKKPLAFEIVWRIKCLSRYLDVSRANTIYQTFKCDKMNGILSAVCKAMGMELPIRNPLKSCCHWCCCYFFKIHCHKMKMKKFERECNRIRERDSSSSLWSLNRIGLCYSLPTFDCSSLWTFNSLCHGHGFGPPELHTSIQYWL